MERVKNYMRYKRNRLYDMEERMYVNYSEVIDNIRDGYSIKVTKKENNQDITVESLIDIIFTMEKRHDKPLPNNIVCEVVRKNGFGNYIREKLNDMAQV